MSYKYFYRIKYERATGDGKWEVGSVKEQFRNSPLTSCEFKHIRHDAFDEIEHFKVTEVRACIYRISAHDAGCIGEFDGTENYENRDYDRLCGRYVPLVSIVHVTRDPFSTYYGWFDCGRPHRTQFHGHLTYKNHRR